MRRTAWKRLFAQREGDENWVLGRILFASFIVSNAASHPILLHTCCDCAFEDNVEFHNIKLPVVSGHAGRKLPTDTTAPSVLYVKLVLSSSSLFRSVHHSLHRKSINLLLFDQWSRLFFYLVVLQAVNASNILSIFISKCELD